LTPTQSNIGTLIIAKDSALLRVCFGKTWPCNNAVVNGHA